MAKAKRFVTQRDVKVERLPWGVYDWLVRPDLVETEELLVARVSMATGSMQPFHRHPPLETVIYVLDGEAEQWVGRRKNKLVSGDVAHIAKDQVHSIRNVGDSTLRYLMILGPASFKGQALVDVSADEPWASLLAADEPSKSRPKKVKAAKPVERAKSAARRVSKSPKKKASKKKATTKKPGSERTSARKKNAK